MPIHRNAARKNAPTLEIRNERAGEMCGVSGRFYAVRADMSGRIVTQRFISELRGMKGGPARDNAEAIRFEARFDDECGNGRESFAITCDLLGPVRRDGRNGFAFRPDIGGGAAHDDIARAFPEVAGLIPWHLTSTDGPMHYVANTVYHAGDRDHNGLRAGERRQILGRDGPCWILRIVAEDGTESDLPGVWHNGAQGAEPPALPGRLAWVAHCRTGEGKARDLAAARSCAVWPEATDAELTAEPAELRAALTARLPALLARFRADMIGAGFVYPNHVPAEESAP